MSPRPIDPAELAVRVARALVEAGVPYAIGGAVAYGFWGNPRGTRDLDVNVFLAAADAGPALDALLAAGLRLDRAAALRQIEESGDVRSSYQDVPVDLFFASIPLHESAATRAVDDPSASCPPKISSS